MNHTVQFHKRMRAHHHGQARLHELEEMLHKSNNRMELADYHKKHKEHHFKCYGDHCNKLKMIVHTSK